MRGPRTPGRIFYTIPRLAEMGECSEYQMRNILRTNGVELHPANMRHNIVLVSSLARDFPDLLDSIRMVTGDE